LTAWLILSDKYNTPKQKQNPHRYEKVNYSYLWFLIFTSVYAQKQIKGVSTKFINEEELRGESTYFPQEDTITLTVTELNYLISRSRIVCSKIDTLDDGGMIKTVEIEASDTNFRFIGAYIESNVFFPQDIKFSVETKSTRLVCEFALVDNGELYESYELDSLGKKYFERLLNKTALVCIDPYKWTIEN